MGYLTRAAKGIPYGNVSNTAVRNILTELSKRLMGGITETEMEDTLEAFGWRCPYTGRDLRASIAAKDGSYVTDHIYPQSQKWCGLNVKGNLIYVDKKANEAKLDQDIETFLLTDTKVLTDVDALGRTRQQRLDEIKSFQAACGYDPDRICSVVSPMLEMWYDEVRAQQEKRIEAALENLDKVGIHAIVKTPVATTGKKGKKPAVTLLLNPADENAFKTALLKSQKAHFVLTYDSGKVVHTKWDAKNFRDTSNLRSNIESKTFWRNGKKEGLVQVEAFVD